MRKKMTQSLSIVLLVSVLFNLNLIVAPEQATAQAAANLIKEGSFEGTITQYWGDFKAPASNRTFQFFRAYDAPYGYGSYSAAIEAQGAPEDPFNGIVSGDQVRNKFAVSAGKKYYLAFHAKATTNATVRAYLQNASDYQPLTPAYPVSVDTQWRKYFVSMEPTGSTFSVLAFVYGDLPDGATVYLDGVTLFEATTAVVSKDVAVKIGQKDRPVKVREAGNFSLTDYEIGLPYFDPSTRTPRELRVKPAKMSGDTLFFEALAGTYPGVGRVYAGGYEIGAFNYDVKPAITQLIPELPRVGDDVTIYGSGFTPSPDSTFAIVKVMGLDKKVNQVWIKPVAVDSKLTQITVRLPAGTVSGELKVQTSYSDVNWQDRVNLTNALPYKIKPVVFQDGVAWSIRGYEHVGDKVRVYGKGISQSPLVNYYGQDGKKLDSLKATVVEIGEFEVIEAPATKKANVFNITVTSGGVESEYLSAISYNAKPLITKVSAKYSRNIYGSADTIVAAKVGDAITLSGFGFTAAEGETQVRFQGISGRFLAPAAEVAANGQTVKVAVPSGAISGYINVQAGPQESNNVLLEIVPTVLAVSPEPLQPGGEVTVTANGIGLNLEEASLVFALDANNHETAKPSALTANPDGSVNLTARAPLAISANASTLNLQYGNWSDNGTYKLSVRPFIENASINLDNRILSIRGYGFSLKASENKITYRYADQDRTVITPKVQVLGVYPTEEGQEIRVKILDNYHYGWVSVQVGDLTSNEANFGPVSIARVARRVEFVPSYGQEMGVLYISGYNFGPEGGVQVGSVWADVHYRSDFFIIAVVDRSRVYDNPVVVAKVQ